MARESWKVSKSLTLDKEDIERLKELRLYEDESDSSVVRRLIRAAPLPQVEMLPSQAA